MHMSVSVSCIQQSELHHEVVENGGRNNYRNGCEGVYAREEKAKT